MGGRGYKNDVKAYLSGNRRTVEYIAVLKPNQKIDFLVNKDGLKDPRLPIFSNTSSKIYVLIGKKENIKAIGFYGSDHRLFKYIHLDHFDNGMKTHVHLGDLYHHNEKESRAPNESEKRIIEYVNSLWNKVRDSESVKNRISKIMEDD